MAQGCYVYSQLCFEADRICKRILSFEELLIRAQICRICKAVADMSRISLTPVSFDSIEKTLYSILMGDSDPA